MQQLVTELADDSGRVSIESTDAVEPEVDVDINIRDDEFQLFESDAGELFIKSPDMPEGVFAEVIPTSEGPITQVTTEVTQEQLSVCEPADRAEQPDLDTTVSSEVIVD